MNLDKLQLFPNQLVDHDETECVGLTVADIIGNLTNTPCDPDFNYAVTFALMGQLPSDGGTDPIAGMQGGVCFGALPATLETFSSQKNGELYAANYNNYTSGNYQAAKLKAQNGVLICDTFDDVVAHMANHQTGVSLPMSWYQNFTSVGADGILPPGAGLTSDHNVAVYEHMPNDTLRIKPWLGSNYGDHGYAYLTRQNFALCQRNLTRGFNPQGNRFWFVLSVVLQRFPHSINYLSKILP